MNGPKKREAYIGIPHVDPNLLWNYELLIPPKETQQLIVSKIEELFSELDKGVESLKTAQQQLKVYRQSLLKWAFEGKLTKSEFRSQNSELAMAAEGKEKYRNGELPEGWRMKKLSELSVLVSDGDHLPPPKSESGIPFITISNIKNNTIDFSQTMFMTEKYYNELKESRKPIKGDILYSVTGSFGIPVLINFDKKFCFQRHIGLIRPQKSTNTKWLFYILQSPQIFKQATETATGTAQKTVALKSLRNFDIPLPPISDQQLIVSELESKLTVCDKIEETINNGLQQSEGLRQSILKQAFEGRLV
ncbi:MAG: restriction endonuclease subunit S [Bacteroidales bacterium]